MSSRTPVSLSYEVFEPVQVEADLNPIILLHGVTLSKENWSNIPQIIANATGRKIYTLDSRNHGDSPWSDLFDFQINVDDLLYFMDTMNIPKAILVGHSMGGRTAIKTALRAPDRVEKMVAEDATVRTPPQFLLSSNVMLMGFANEAVQEIPPNSTEDEAKDFIFNYVNNHIPDKLKPYSSFKRDDPRLILKHTSDGSFEFKCNLNVVLEKLKNSEAITTPVEGTYEGPACFIYGRKSPFLVGRDEQLIKNFFPNAELVGIDDAAHLVHEDFPLPFTDALLNFIQGGWNKKK